MYGISAFNSSLPAVRGMRFGEKEAGASDDVVRFETNPFLDPFEEVNGARVRPAVMRLLRARAAKKTIELPPDVQLPDIAAGRGFKAQA